VNRAQAQEIGRTLGQRHVVEYANQKWLVVNVTRALTPGMPVIGFCLSRDMDAPLAVGGTPVDYRRVKVWRSAESR
jgi:hypothetical protein